MKVSSGVVTKVAKLAKLKLDESDEQKYSQQLSKILDYIDLLNEVDTKDVEPTFNVTGLQNIFQADITISSLSQKEAISNKETKDGYFATKGVFFNE